jgi:hypothetical protein
VARFVHRGARAYVGRTLDALALVVATVLPLLLASATSFRRTKVDPIVKTKRH